MVIARRLRLGWKLLLVAAIALPVAFGQGSAVQGANADAKLPAFDVVSIKPVQTPCKGSGFSPTLDGLHVWCLPLQIILQQVYGIYESSRIGGIPDSLGWAFYDIDAKVDSADVAAYGKLTAEQRNLMFQALLQDRFKLKAHRESKELPIFALVIAKGGSKLRESKPEEAVAQTGAQTGPIMWKKGHGEIVCRSNSIAALPRFLSEEVGRPVADRTGLTGKYDFTLQWTPDTGAGSTAAGADADAGPSIFTALEEQLGLKLEPAKAPMDVLVVDHIERPSEN